MGRREDVGGRGQGAVACRMTLFEGVLWV